MGEVHLAQYESLPGVRKLAAIKILRVDLEGPAAHTSLLHEARVTAHFSHPNVVQLLDAGIEDDAPWLALEFVAGVSLREMIQAAREKSVPVSPWIFARILADACAGLHAVHEARDERGKPLEIVHRDVSPQNILLSWDGVVKLADFGVARSSIQSSATRTGTVKGKLGYMAPEQARGGQVDRRTDVFAMGILLWEALAEKRLFSGQNESETLARVLMCKVPPLAEASPNASKELGALAHRALSPEPSARFESALEMRQAIEAVMVRAGVTVREPEVAETLATLVPNRVREHEAWLSDASIVEQPPPVASRSRRRAILVATSIIVPAAVLLTIALRPDAPIPLAAPIPTPTATPTATPTPAPTPTPTPTTASFAARPKLTGTLDIGSRPVWSRIKVDGRVVGETPVLGVKLAAGTHVVEAIPEGRRAPLRRSVVVSADQSARVVFDVPPE